jgi:acyl-CoA synthetase (AMP-forming)/AMP-acid ligase II
MPGTRPELDAGAQSLSAILHRRAARQPNDLAYAVLRNGEDPADQVTYGELDRAVRARAEVLRERGLAGRNAIMLYPTGLEFIRAMLACQVAGVGGAPVKVPNRRNGLLRVRAVADDADSPAILTTTAVRGQLMANFETLPELSGLDWVETDTAPEAPYAAFDGPEPDPDGVALLQYTSGSTGSPKGVMVSHRNLCANAADIERPWPAGDDGRIVSWLPLFHDMGLLFGVVMPLWRGVPAYLMAPDDFVRRPLRWLEAISRFRGTHAAAPNLGYELCVRAAPELSPGLPLDLSSWRIAANGSEPVRWSTLQRFIAAFAPYGFNPHAACPGYGLAENTLKVTASRATEPPRALWVSQHELAHGRAEVADPAAADSVPIVSCGPTDGDSGVSIVEPDTSRPLADGSVGEIWVTGPCVALGYWRKPAESVAVFAARMAGDPTQSPYLRTGDLGFIHDGHLYVTGRIKDVIIHFGRNHYPQDLEQTVEACVPGLEPSCAAAFSVEHEDSERVVVLVEVNGRVLRGTPAAAVTAAVRDAVWARHALPIDDVVLIRRGTLPRTSSGKVRRGTCRQDYLAGALKLAAVLPERAAVAAAT